MTRFLLSKYPVLLLILVFILLVCFYFESKSLHRGSLSRIEQELKVCTMLLAPSAKDYLAKKDLDGFKSFCEQNLYPLSEFDIRITVFLEEGDVVFDSWNIVLSSLDNHNDRPEFRALLEERDDNDPFDCCTYIRYSDTTKQQMLYCITGFDIDKEYYCLRSSVSIKQMNLVLHPLHQDAQTMMLLADIIALMLAYLGYYWLSRPTEQLKDAARQIVNGDLKTPVPVSQTGAFKEISNALGLLSDTLRQKIYDFSLEKCIRDAIFGSLSDGIILLEPDGHIVDINRAAIEILRSEKQYNKGMKLAQIGNISISQLLSLPNSDIVLPSEGHDRQIHVSVQTIQWVESSTGYLLILYDLTRLKKLENFRRDFIANLSHEIKTPLTVIMGAVEALEDGAIDAPHMAKSFLEKLNLHAHRLHDLVEDVLSLSNLECQTRKEDLELEQLPLIDSIEQAVHFCQDHADKRGIHLQIVDHSNYCEVAIVSRMMDQVWNNLIENAIKYSPRESRVTIVIDEPNGNLIQVHVTDQGMGIAEEDQQRVFDRFFRVDKSGNSSPRGTGLGLAIVKHIIQLHGGWIDLDSTPGQGSKFTITLKIDPFIMDQAVISEEDN